MKTHLAPLIGLHPDVKINQCIEYVISKPIDRNGQVFITRDRSADRPIKLSIQEFEDQTGTYIVGLEPTYEYCLTNLIAEFAKDIETRDFNRIPNHLYYGEIKFSTDRNTIVEVSVHLMNVTEGYTVSVRRNAGGMNKIKRFVGPEGALPLLLDNALRVIDEYITTKVQILSKAEDTTTPIDRQYSEEGFAILRTNESLNDYFKEGRNNKKAGIVINLSGKYQIFRSYRNDLTQEDTLHHESRSYKTLRGAQKAINAHGFDVSGRQLDILDSVQFAEDFRNYNRHTGMTNSWDSSVTSSFQLDNGFGELGLLDKSHDEQLGYRYSLKANYIDEKSGKTITQVFSIDPRDNSCLGSATRQLYDFIATIKKAYAEDASVFDIDSRTEMEILHFHQERLAVAYKDVKFYRNVIEKQTHGESCGFMIKRLDLYNSLIQHHETAISNFSKKNLCR